MWRIVSKYRRVDGFGIRQSNLHAHLEIPKKCKRCMLNVLDTEPIIVILEAIAQKDLYNRWRFNVKALKLEREPLGSRVIYHRDCFLDDAKNVGAKKLYFEPINRTKYYWEEFMDLDAESDEEDEIFY